MGAPMAGHLMDAGYGLRFTIAANPKADPCFSRGAKWASRRPQEAAANSDIVFSIVGYPKGC